MADRVLTWHAPERTGDGLRIGPAFYMDEDYTPGAVRLQVETAGRVLDAEVDILDDGVTIFADRTTTQQVSTSTKGPTTSRGAAKTTAVLVEGDTVEEGEDSFVAGVTLLKGSWVTCKVTKYGDAKNLSVHLEMDRA